MNNSSYENDNRTFLNDGTIINLKGTEYRILELKGRGASCVVYLAENCTNKRIVLIKELYPIDLGIFRDKENNLIVPNSFCEHFKFYKHKLCEAYKLQLEFHNSDETGNYTSDAETMVEAYSTLYVIMNKVVGSSYDKVVPENITDVLEVCKSVATVIGFYHKKGYLHLDIKPDNIYVLKETNQIINLFDFDTVKLKSDLENGNYIASTNKISAPEISKAEIDEFTGKYLQEVDERADIYAIGHILFEKVMERDAKSSDIILGKKFNLGKTKLLENSSPQLREKIQEIFQHTVVRMKSERYSNTDELIKALDQALEIATEEKDGYLIDDNITVTTSNSYYISRKDKLSEIRQHLENYHIAYLYGIGGIGKSETAREYAEEYRDSYTTIQLSVYSGDLKALIAGLKFSSDDKSGDYFEKDINIRYETKLSLLSKAMINNERTLLIIDNYNVEPDSDEYKRNVEVMKDLKKLHIHILFTTRTSPNDDKTKIDIEELSKEELRHMFFAINPKDIGKEERIAQVDELIETAYRHTLTVDLVAHQTAKIEGYGKKTLSDYIKVLKESGINSGINVAVYNNKDDNGKSDIIFEHIRALFNLTALTEKEKYIMVNACLLPLSGMPVAEFESFIDLENYPNSESNDGWGEDSTISSLVKSGWIKRIDGEVSKITLHPIVSEVAINELKPEITEDKCKNFCDSVSELIDNNNLKSVDAYKDIFIGSAGALLKNEDEISVGYVSDIADILYDLAYYSESLCYYMKVLAIQEKVLPENHPDIATSYDNVGYAYGELGEHKKELEYKLKALAIREKVLPENHPDIAISYNSLGYACNELRDHKKSLDYFSKALEIREKVLPENHPDIAVSYNNVGSAYSKLGDRKKALEYLLKALAIEEKVLPENHPDIATSYNNIGYAYGELGDRKKALEYLLKALAIREKVLPENHPAIAASYNNIGCAYGKLGDHKKALDYGLKALEKKSNNNIGLIEALINVGCAYANLGDYTQSISYCLKALKISENVLPKGNSYIVNLYKAISNIYYLSGDVSSGFKYELKFLSLNDNLIKEDRSSDIEKSKLLNNSEHLDNLKQALYYHMKTLKTRKKFFPLKYLDIAKSLNSICCIYYKLSDYSNSVKFGLEALSIREKELPMNHPDIATSYNSVGCAYSGLGNNKKALEHCLKALSIREKVLPENHPDIAVLYNNIGVVYMDLKEYKKALQYLLLATPIFEQTVPKNNAQLAKLYSRISKAYANLGDEENSEKYLKLYQQYNDQ